MFNKKKSKGISLKDLENQEEKTKLDINKKKNKKSLKPQTMAALKFIKVLLWSSLILILLIGVLQVLRSKQPKIIKNTLEYNISEAESDTAKAFAVTFAKEYLTYDVSKGDDYKRRIMPFMISTLGNGAKIEFSKGSSIVKDAIVWKVDKLSKQHSNIIVRTVVEAKNNTDMVDVTNELGEKEKKAKIVQKVVYLNVPVGYYDGGFIVEDYPTFSPDPQQPSDITLNTFSNEKSELDNVKEELRTVLSNFFKTYSSGTEGQIAYYMENNKAIKGFEGKYIFEDIQSLEAYKENDNTIVVVQTQMRDASLDTAFVQRFIFTMKKTTDNGGRWYISKFQTRGSIFKDQEGEK